MSNSAEEGIEDIGNAVSEGIQKMEALLKELQAMDKAREQELMQQKMLKALEDISKQTKEMQEQMEQLQELQKKMEVDPNSEEITEEQAANRELSPEEKEKLAENGPALNEEGGNEMKANSLEAGGPELGEGEDEGLDLGLDDAAEKVGQDEKQTVGQTLKMDSAQSQRQLSIGQGHSVSPGVGGP